MKPRHHVYIDQDVSDELERLSAAPGTSKSAIVADALRRHFKFGGAGEHDAAIRMRLDRLSRAFERLAKDVGVIRESLTIYVKYDFMLTAHMAEPDRVAHAKATERFNRFTNAVARSLAQGGTPADQEASETMPEISDQTGDE